MALKELRIRIKDLKTKEDASREAEKYRSLTVNLQTVLENVKSIESQSKVAGVVFEGWFENVRTTTKSVCSNAQKQSKRILKDSALITSDDFRNDILGMDDRSEAQKREMKKRWSEKIEQNVSKLDPLVNAISALPGNQAGAAIARKLDSIRSYADRLPQTKKEAESIKQDIESVGKMISTAGFDGPIGAFLKKAVAGQATLEDATKPQVLKYLKEKDLLKSFNVIQPGS